MKQSFSYPSKPGPVVLTRDDPRRLANAALQNHGISMLETLKELNTILSFFLIASTGLGKTVVVPLYLLHREMQLAQTPEPAVSIPGPRVWVVEPKIAIAQSLYKTMNLWWSQCTEKERPELRGFSLFGCKTKVDNRDMDAPVMFITTGIFSIYARNGVFQPGRDTVLIDEAHVTLETDEALELGIGICRQRGVRMQYMSATVDAADIPGRLGVSVVRAEKKRFPVWRHSLGQPIDEVLTELVEQTLINPLSGGAFFPPEGDERWQSVREAVAEQERAKGMLVIVNSYAADDSDAKRLERILKAAPYANQLAIRTLAGEVLRDPAKRAAYEADVRRWKQEKARYVLIATSVVEMGVTLPDLDFVVTMDSTLEEVENGVRLVPLGANALIQRIGRVGRERPGIAYISREIGAEYSRWSDEVLNAPDALKPESIRWPTADGRLDWLAYYSFKKGWSSESIAAEVHAMKLPSQLGSEDIARLETKREEFLHAGLADGKLLTAKGEEVEGWLGFRPLDRLPRLRLLVRAYDARGFFFEILKEAALESEDVLFLSNDAYDDIPSDDPERFPHVFMEGADALSVLHAGTYCFARAWIRFEESLYEMENGSEFILMTLRLAARMMDEATIHIDQEFKRDRSSVGRTFQKRFLHESRFYQALVRQFLL